MRCVLVLGSLQRGAERDEKPITRAVFAANAHQHGRGEDRLWIGTERALEQLGRTT